MGKNRKGQPGVKAVAEAAGVSSATVSRVFNQHAYVSDDIRDKVLKVARAMGYAPSISSSRNLFGIMVATESSFFQPYSHQVMLAVAKEMMLNNCNIQMFNRDMFPYILRNTFRGVLVFNAADAGFFRKLRIPCVVINDLAPGYWNVATDHMQSIRVAVEYLLKLGHCRIGYLGAGYDAWGCNERRRGYQETVRSAGVPEIMEFYSSRGQSIDDAIGKLLTRQITGLIVEGEENGLIADHALKSRGVKIPDDLSLITFESCNTSCFIYPAHTTVMQDFDGMGKAAAQVLLKLTIQADRKTVLPETQMFSNRLIERDSCKKLT